MSSDFTDGLLRELLAKGQSKVEHLDDLNSAHQIASSAARFDPPTVNGHSLVPDFDDDYQNLDSPELIDGLPSVQDSDPVMPQQLRTIHKDSSGSLIAETLLQHSENLFDQNGLSSLPAMAESSLDLSADIDNRLQTQTAVPSQVGFLPNGAALHESELGSWMEHAKEQASTEPLASSIAEQARKLPERDSPALAEDVSGAQQHSHQGDAETADKAVVTQTNELQATEANGEPLGKSMDSQLTDVPDLVLARGSAMGITKGSGLDSAASLEANPAETVAPLEPDPRSAAVPGTNTAERLRAGEASAGSETAVEQEKEVDEAPAAEPQDIEMLDRSDSGAEPHQEMPSDEEMPSPRMESPKSSVEVQARPSAAEDNGDINPAEPSKEREDDCKPSERDQPPDKEQTQDGTDGEEQAEDQPEAEPAVTEEKAELVAAEEPAPPGRQKRRAATAAMQNVKSFLAKEGVSDSKGVSPQAIKPQPIRRERKRRRVESPPKTEQLSREKDGSEPAEKPVVVPVRMETSLKTLSVPVLVKSESEEDMIRISGAEECQARGLTEQSVFAASHQAQPTARSKRPKEEEEKAKEVSGSATTANPVLANGKKKLDRKTMLALRLRPDGTPKRKYTRRNPLPGKGQAANKNSEDAEPKETAQTTPKKEAKKVPERTRPQRQIRRNRRRADSPSSEEASEDEGADLASSESEPEVHVEADPIEEEEEPCDELFGCSGCSWTAAGCSSCRQGSPAMIRPRTARWQPHKGRPQENIPEAPTFYPTEEEFADPLSYINKIREHGEKAGIACIVPPKGWAPPFALDRGTNGQSAESFRFSIRKQPTWQLCMRKPNPKSSAPRNASAHGRTDAEIPDQADESHVHAEGRDENGFGFVTLDRTHTLDSFRAYADWAKERHFGTSSIEEGPSVEEIEAEFWRIVETPEEAVENLYGQDLDSGHHGSGFPLPPSRKRQLEALLAQKMQSQNEMRNSPNGTEGSTATTINYNQEEQAYSEHSWNINNLPRCKGSVLRYVIGEELITGVMVPWLYVGSCMSAFCWHIEDHALYSINYLHKGAPKIWYGVPSNASEALEKAMKDAFPEHFETAPDLLYQLVTMLSPSQLKARAVPVHRVVHKEGSFVITFPNAYHSGFNSGFNCAEAVNFAPPDWLPWGCNILNKYRRDGKAATLSNDALLIALVKGAPAVHEAALKRANAAREVESVAPEAEFKSVCAFYPKPDPQKQKKTSAEANESSSKAQEAVAPEKDTQSAQVPGQRADTSYLDAIKVEDAPAHGVRLAAAELRLRVQEERRRRDIGLKDVPNLQTLKMSGQPGDKDQDGLLINTEDMDCQECKCDLWLSAVVSRSNTEQHFCPEHAPSMTCPKDSWILLYRYTLEELESMLAVAEESLGGVEEAQAIVNRVHNPPKVEVKKLGPVADLIPQIPQTPSREETPPSSKRRRVVKQDAKPPKKEAQPEKKEAQPVKKEAPPATIATRRTRAAAKAQPTPKTAKPKAISRGPGKRNATKIVDVEEAELDEAEKDDGSASEGWSPVADDELLEEDSDRPARGRRGGRSGRGRGAGRGRGRGRRKPVQESPDFVPSSDLSPNPAPEVKPDEQPTENAEKPSESAAEESSQDSQSQHSSPQKTESQATEQSDEGDEEEKKQESNEQPNTDELDSKTPSSSAQQKEASGREAEDQQDLKGRPSSHAGSDPPAQELSEHRWQRSSGQGSEKSTSQQARSNGTGEGRSMPQPHPHTSILMDILRQSMMGHPHHGSVSK